MTLAKLLEQTWEGGEMLREARERARPECIAAARKLEGALVAALDGEKLRGLPVLCDEPGAKFYGARVRGRVIDGALDDRPILILAEDGRLRMAALSGDVGDPRRIWTALAADENLLAEDVEDVARAAEEVLRRHLANVALRTARYQRLRDLAAALSALLA